MNSALLAGMGYYTIDIVCAALILIFTLIGARKGAIRSVIGLCSTVLSLIAAYYLAVPVSKLLNEWFSVFEKGGETLWIAVSGVLVFLLCKIVLDLIGKLLTKLADSVKAVGALNTLLGAVIGFIKGAILICAVLAVISLLPETMSFATKAQEAIDNTFFVHAIRDHNPLLAWMSKMLERAKDIIAK